jgi:hypothetical protein
LQLDGNHWKYAHPIEIASVSPEYSNREVRGFAQTWNDETICGKPNDASDSYTQARWQQVQPLKGLAKCKQAKLIRCLVEGSAHVGMADFLHMTWVGSNDERGPILVGFNMMHKRSS